MICLIGGANIDLQGFSNKKLIFNDSNPGKLRKGFGGVCRNICENLSRLNQKCSLIVPIGDDSFSKSLSEYMINLSVDLSKSKYLKNEDLSTYLSILDEDNEMILAISSMDILEKLDISHLKQYEEFLLKQELLVIDTNLRKDVLEYLSKLKIPKLIDLVSTTKAKKVKDFIGNFEYVKANKLEAELISQIKINSEEDLVKIGNYLLNLGVKNIFITLGSDGMFFMNHELYMHVLNPKIEVNDITGAGDAFCAGLAYSIVNNFDIEKSAKYAISMSIINVSNLGTCYTKLNEDLLHKTYIKYFI